MDKRRADLVPPLEYVRMFIEVTGWVREAQHDDECERLSDLAQSYLKLSVKSCEIQREQRTSCLPADVQAYFAAKASPPQRQIDVSEFEAIRARCAVTSAAQLQQLTYPELQNLADMFEGWAQDSRLYPVQIARLLGMADGLRDLSDLAGPGWRPAVDGEESLTRCLARRM